MWKYVIGAALALLGVAPAAQAQSWPSKPVRILVAFPAGGATDAGARAYAEKLSVEFGQQFVVENRTGAAGAIGHEACAKAPNDGYTLCFNTMGGLAILPNIRKMPYDPLKDFTSIGRATDALFGFASHPERPWKTMQEFVTLAKANPGKYTLANSGIGSVTHFSGEIMAAGMGIKLTMVPYKGGVEQLQDALAGHVDMMFEGNIFPHIKSGKLRGLAVSTPFRHPHFPDIPSMKEVLPGWNVSGWSAVMGPAGLPPAVVERMAAVLPKIADMPDVKERLLGMGVLTLKDTPDALAAEIRKQVPAFAELVKQLGIKVE
jgi:tripartite-type tricarboxylate transporter receptor subunit TctC